MTLKDLVQEHRIGIFEICYCINKIAILDGYELFSSGLGIKFHFSILRDLVLSLKFVLI